VLKGFNQLSILALAITISFVSHSHAAPIDEFEGRWALTIPGGGAGWLGVTQENGYYDSSILWGGGSVVPTASTYIDQDGKLIVTRTHTQERKINGEVVKTHTFTETLKASLSGDTIKIVRYNPNRNGNGMNVEEFSGKRIVDLPPAPDLSKAKYGKPIKLLKKNGLDGWELLDKNPSGWSVKNGVLSNNPVQPEGKHIRYANLRTVDEFEDFNLTLEASVPKGGNSGIYLRGIYEVQVMDSYGMEKDNHHMGAVYSRITPSEAVEKAPGEWQTVDITLLNRHITVILNGTTIIDNEALLGCTGGAMTSDEFKPGPLYLQGDHSGVSYRNVILKPITN
jgi:hypothetical protein